MSKKFKKQVSLILAVIKLLSTLAVFANAACTYWANAFNISTTSQYAKVYPLSASGTQSLIPQNLFRPAEPQTVHNEVPISITEPMSFT